MSYLKVREMMARHGGRVVNKQINLRCPLCGKRNFDLTVGGNGCWVGNCFSPQCKGRGKELIHLVGLDLNPLPEDLLARVREEIGAGQPEGERASADVRHRVYAEWFKQCPIDDRAAAFMAAKGLSREDCEAIGYGSWPHPVSLDARGAAGVPGVYVQEGRAMTALSHPRYAGVLVPVCDMLKRIVALKLRLYEPDEAGKYRTFSSTHWGGPSAERAVHFPRGMPVPAERVYLVEGEMKADLLWFKTGTPSVSVPGVQGI